MNTVKKTYVKPALELVDFTLSSSIAGNCTFTANFAEKVCSPVIEDNGYTVYNAAYLCDYELNLGDGAGNTDGVCYHVPVADANICAS